MHSLTIVIATPLPLDERGCGRDCDKREPAAEPMIFPIPVAAPLDIEARGGCGRDCMAKRLAEAMEVEERGGCGRDCMAKRGAGQVSVLLVILDLKGLHSFQL